MLKLYDYLPSGNGYKVRLLMHQLGIPFELETLDIWSGATRTPAFLKKNPNGRIPTLQLEDGRHLWESHAIMWYLADGSALIPANKLAKAQVLQWMCFEQYELEPALGVIRARKKFKGTSSDPIWPETERKLRLRGTQALEVLNAHLKGRVFLVNDCYSLADIAVFAYVHVASEADFDMTPYPNILAWQKIVENQPLHIPITWRPS